MDQDSESTFDIDSIISEFEKEIRLGRSPSIRAFQMRYPEFAAEIGNLFPTVAAIEKAKRMEGSNTAQSPKTLNVERLGEFKILRELGRGGMGVVFEAEQISLGRRVAVKVLPDYRLLSKNALARFRQEARTAAKLHHTNIVSILDVGESDGLHYYAMQYIDGIGLDDIVRHLSPLPRSAKQNMAGRTDSQGAGDESVSVNRALHHCKLFAEIRGKVLSNNFSLTNSDRTHSSKVGRKYFRSIAKIALQVADALDYAHRNKVLHRDIKPANLMIDPDGKVWVMDFGVAKAFEDLAISLTGDVVGTPRYMAPEQFQGKSKAQSDIYGLGVTMFELLTRRPADESVRDADSVSSIANFRPLKNIRNIDPSVPRDLETIVMRATATDPARRYKTAASLAVDLQRFIFNQPIRTRRASFLTKTARWCVNQPAIAALLLLAIFLTTGILALATNNYFQEVAHRRKIESTLGLFVESLDRVYSRNSPASIQDLALPLNQRNTNGLGQDQFSASNQTVLLEEFLPYYEQVAILGDGNPRFQLDAAQAIQRVGQIHCRLGNWSEAERAFRIAIDRFGKISITPSNQKTVYLNESQTWVCLGVHFLRQYDSAESENCFQKAFAALREFESRAPRAFACHDIQFELARVHYHLGVTPKSAPGSIRHEQLNCRQHPVIEETSSKRRSHLNDAITILDQLINRFPSSAKCTNLKALCLRERSIKLVDDDLREATSLFNNLVDNFPEVDEFRINLCETYAWMSPPRLAETEYPAALARLDLAIKESVNLDKRTIRCRLMLEHTHHKLSTLILRCLENQPELLPANREQSRLLAVTHAKRAIEIHQSVDWEADQYWASIWLHRFRKAKIKSLMESSLQDDWHTALKTAQTSVDDLRCVSAVKDHESLISELDKSISLMREVESEIRTRETKSIN